MLKRKLESVGKLHRFLLKIRIGNTSRPHEGLDPETGAKWPLVFLHFSLSFSLCLSACPTPLHVDEMVKPGLTPRGFQLVCSICIRRVSVPAPLPGRSSHLSTLSQVTLYSPFNCDQRRCLGSDPPLLQGQFSRREHGISRQQKHSLIPQKPSLVGLCQVVRQMTQQEV